jgi:hypothetical protein
MKGNAIPWLISCATNTTPCYSPMNLVCDFMCNFVSAAASTVETWMRTWKRSWNRARNHKVRENSINFVSDRISHLHANHTRDRSCNRPLSVRYWIPFKCESMNLLRYDIHFSLVSPAFVVSLYILMLEVLLDFNIILNQCLLTIMYIFYYDHADRRTRYVV